MPSSFHRSTTRRRPLARALAGVLATFAVQAEASAPGAQDLADFLLSPSVHDAHLRTPDELARLADTYGLHAYLPDATRATRPVTNCNDNGAGSLRGEIALAASGDTIDLRNLGCSAISLTTGQIAIAVDNLAILGPGRSALTIKAGGGKYENRIFNHSGQGNLVIQGLTVSDGLVGGRASAQNVAGGCIRSNGVLTLGNPFAAALPETGVAVRNCRAIAAAGGLGSGGGLYANQVTLVNSIVSGCELQAQSDGGGFRIDGGGGVFAGSRLLMMNSELVDNDEDGSKYGGGGAAVGLGGEENRSLILSSTIAGNGARFGGGLSLFGNADVRNTTLSGNTAYRGGGLGISGLGSNVTIANSTITANVAITDNTGGGIEALIGGNAIPLTSTLVAGNFRSTSVPSDIANGNSPDSSVSGANNLIGVSAMPVPAGTITGVDPRLRPLGWYGGPTRTHALMADSQAIGAGSNPANETYDQRGNGYPRQVGQRVDIGAFEYSDRIFTNGFD